MSKNKKNTKHNLKIFPLILALFFVVFLISFLIFNFFYPAKNQKLAQQITPEPSAIPTTNPEKLFDALVDTQGWKTYENPYLGFKLKYPENFYLYDENINSCEGCYSKLYEMTIISKANLPKAKTVSTGELADHSSILIRSIDEMYENVDELIRRPGVKLEEIGDLKFYFLKASLQNDDTIRCLVTNGEINLYILIAPYDNVEYDYMMGSNYTDIYKTILSTLQAI